MVRNFFIFVERSRSQNERSSDSFKNIIINLGVLDNMNVPIVYLSVIVFRGIIMKDIVSIYLKL